jgi:hypothetical protein
MLQPHTKSSHNIEHARAITGDRMQQSKFF